MPNDLELLAELESSMNDMQTVYEPRPPYKPLPSFSVGEALHPMLRHGVFRAAAGAQAVQNLGPVPEQEEKEEGNQDLLADQSDVAPG